MLDPQVQIRIIDLAWQWAKDTLQPLPGPKTQENRIQARVVGFHNAYRAIVKTVQADEFDTIPINQDEKPDDSGA